MNKIKKFYLSKLALIFILVYTFVLTAQNQKWKHGVIEWDIISYYAYLPGLFIYQDLTFSFLDANPPEGVKIWTEPTPDNKRVIKMTSGLAILYAPFFLIAHGISLLQPETYTPNGYTVVYSILLILSDIFYTFIGFVFLRKILIRYFSDIVTTTTLICLFLGTNILFYSMFEVMAHCYLFCLITLFLYYTIRWHEKPSILLSIALGLLFGLITLIRPVDIIVILVFALYGITSFADIKPRLFYLWNMKKELFLIGLFSFLIVAIQLAYWKYATGHFFYWSYNDENFFWTNPHILEGLLSFRKGWYIYTPIMLFSTLGLFFTHKYIKDFSLSFILLFACYTYIIFSWWCWWYGGGLSCRPMIDIYGIMGIGLACFITYISNINYLAVKFITACCMVLFVYYNIKEVNYYLEGALHYDSMTFTAWKIRFLEINTQGEDFYKTLSEPNYDNAKKYGQE